MSTHPLLSSSRRTATSVREGVHHLDSSTMLTHGNPSEPNHPCPHCGEPLKNLAVSLDLSEDGELNKIVLTCPKCHAMIDFTLEELADAFAQAAYADATGRI